MDIQSVEPELVVVKAFDGKALVRWLVGICPTVAQITDADGVAAVRSGKLPQFSVGFPFWDVFRWDKHTRISDGDEPNWDTLAPRF